MIIVDNSGLNRIVYYSRYNQIDKYEIYDHSSNITTSGLTTLVGYNGKIDHSGITYQFVQDRIYTYKSYWFYDGKYYLSNQSMMRCFADDSRLNENYVIPEKTNTFKNKT